MATALIAKQNGDPTFAESPFGKFRVVEELHLRAFVVLGALGLQGRKLLLREDGCRRLHERRHVLLRAAVFVTFGRDRIHLHFLLGGQIELRVRLRTIHLALVARRGRAASLVLVARVN